MVLCMLGGDDYTLKQLGHKSVLLVCWTSFFLSLLDVKGKIRNKGKELEVSGKPEICASSQTME